MTRISDLEPLDWAGLRALQPELLFQGPLRAMAHSRLRLGQVYLATPYSERVKVGGEYDEFQSEFAGSQAAEWLLQLSLYGVSAVSPIVQAVAMLREDQVRALRPLDAGWWEAWCRPLLASSRVVAVPMLPGWDASYGVWGEVICALQAGLSVVVIEDIGRVADV